MTSHRATARIYGNSHQIVVVDWVLSGVAPGRQPELRVGVQREVEFEALLVLYDEVCRRNRLRLGERLSPRENVVARQPAATSGGRISVTLGCEKMTTCSLKFISLLSLFY